MKLSKAIEILNLALGGDEPASETDLIDAINLSVEAFRAIRLHRRGLVVDFNTPLPGETPEDNPQEDLTPS